MDLRSIGTDVQTHVALELVLRDYFNCNEVLAGVSVSVTRSGLKLQNADCGVAGGHVCDFEGFGTLSDALVAATIKLPNSNRELFQRVSAGRTLRKSVRLGR